MRWGEVMATVRQKNGIGTTVTKARFKNPLYDLHGPRQHSQQNTAPRAYSRLSFLIVESLGFSSF